jgi:hypothetical protein
MASTFNEPAPILRRSGELVSCLPHQQRTWLATRLTEKPPTAVRPAIPGPA